ncbi:acyltransferase domain-containing protein [Gynuella sp.]|uniref:acyltransferase domain-containing protein n=1 Tax=Gynuella sp. TaxID=2969146 RepID=UPI003D0F7CCB
MTFISKDRPQTGNSATPSSNRHSATDTGLIFMFAGQGSQYFQMGRELYDHDDIFRHHMDRCDRLLSFDLRDVLYNDAHKGGAFDAVEWTHPALFCLGYSLAQVLIEQGYRPSGVLGHSLGEYIAATIAGMFSLEEGLELVVRQAQILKQTCAEGSMITVMESPEFYRKRPDIFFRASLGGINYDGSFFVSGLADDLQRVLAALNSASVFSVQLPVRYGFHSSAIDPAESEFRNICRSVRLSRPQIPFYSCALAGDVSRHVWDSSDEYLWRIPRGEAQFKTMVENSFPNPERYTFIDLSATATLSGFLKYGFGDRYTHHFAINQFGRNLDSMATLLSQITP